MLSTPRPVFREMLRSSCFRDPFMEGACQGGKRPTSIVQGGRTWVLTRLYQTETVGNEPRAREWAHTTGRIGLVGAAERPLGASQRHAENLGDLWALWEAWVTVSGRNG